MNIILLLVLICNVICQLFQEYDLSYIDLNNGQNIDHLSKYIRTLDLYKVVKQNIMLQDGTKIICNTPIVNWTKSSNYQMFAKQEVIQMPEKLFNIVIKMLGDQCAIHQASTFVHKFCADKFFVEFDDLKTVFNNQKTGFEVFFKGISNSYLPIFTMFNKSHQHHLVKHEKIFLNFECQQKYCQYILQSNEYNQIKPQLYLSKINTINKHLYTSGYIARILYQDQDILIQSVNLKLVIYQQQQIKIINILKVIDNSIFLLDVPLEEEINREFIIYNPNPNNTAEPKQQYQVCHNLLILDEYLLGDVEQLIILMASNELLVANIIDRVSQHSMIIDIQLDGCQIINSLYALEKKEIAYSFQEITGQQNFAFGGTFNYLKKEFQNSKDEFIIIMNDQTQIYDYKLQMFKILSVSNDMIIFQNPNQLSEYQYKGKLIILRTNQVQKQQNLIRLNGFFQQLKIYNFIQSLEEFDNRNEKLDVFQFGLNSTMLFQVGLFTSEQDSQLKIILGNEEQSIELFIGTSGQMNYILIKKQRGNFKEWNPFYRNSTIFDQPIWIFNGIEGIIIGVGEMATIKSVVLNYPHEIAISSLKISSKYSHNINVKDIYFNHLTSNSFLLKDFKKKIYNQFTDTFNNQFYNFKYNQKYKTGSYCPAANKERTINIFYSCGEQILEIKSITEPEICTYQTDIRSSLFCLNEQFADTKTFVMEQTVVCVSNGKIQQTKPN